MDLPPARPAASAARRKNTSKACDECRRRRAKCDGQVPACSRCQVRSLRCQYRAQEDGRRPAPKSYVEMLRGRIDMLEGILRSHSIDVDASIAALRSPRDVNTAPTAGIADDPGVEELSAAFGGAFSLDESINYDQDGEIRYYGATSGRLGFQSPRESANCTPASSSSHSRPCNSTVMTRMKYDSFLEAMGQDSTPEELKEHLIALYFKWQNPWFQVVSEKLFRESEKNNGRYCSPLLLACILALGSRFTDRPDVRSDPDDPNTAGSVFLEKAESLLHYDLKWPSLTTIQALGIMIEIYTSTGQDAAAWLHQGMADRLALDMGLNLDGETLIESQCITLEEVELRRQIFWALYCDDKLSAAYTGRVCTMLEVQHKLNLPTVPSHGSSNAINPYVPTLLLRALIRLSQITEKTILGLYAPNASHRKSPDILPFIESRILDLQTWYYDLPSELRIERSSSINTQPQVYTLLMVYHTNYILLLRPLFSCLTPDTHAKLATLAQKASSMSLKAAKQISLIGKKYQQVFGSFRRSPVTATHCSLSAAVVLIHAELTQTQPNSGTSNSSDLQTLLTILGELSISWDIARRIRQSLLETLEKKYPGVYSHDLPDTVTSNHMSGEDYQVPGSDFITEPSNSHGPGMRGAFHDSHIDPFADNTNSLEEQLSYPAFLESIPTTVPSAEGVMGTANDIDTFNNILQWPAFVDLDMDLNNAGALPGDYHFFDSLSHLNGDGTMG